MVRSKPLSNRQRKAAQKGPAKPRSARKAAPHSVAIVAEPRGVAAREAIRDDVLGRERARLAAALACGDHTAEDVHAEMKTEAVVGAEMVAVDDRGERRAGVGLRLQSRDGLVALHKSGALSDDQVKAGLAYRLCYEIAEQALGSCLGRVGEGRGARDWSQLSIAVTAEGEFRLMRSAADLQRAYAVARLNQIERAVFGLADPEGKVWLTDPDGRELGVLRQVAGEGMTLREAAGSSGHARDMARTALGRALDCIVGVLRITGQ